MADAAKRKVRLYCGLEDRPLWSFRAPPESAIGGAHQSPRPVHRHEPIARYKSLAGIAQLVGSSDPLDITGLAEDCEGYLADQNAEKVLARYCDAPAPPPTLFQFDYRRRPPCLRLRAGLFELWLRAEPKPKGGLFYCGSMDNELPVLHWLLRERAVEVFEGLIGTHRKAIEEFVSWFLDKARPYAKYFTGRYHYTSSTTYTYGRPRFAAWSLLGKEVQDASTSLGIPFPKSLRLPAMPDLE